MKLIFVLQRPFFQRFILIDTRTFYAIFYQLETVSLKSGKETNSVLPYMMMIQIDVNLKAEESVKICRHKAWTWSGGTSVSNLKRTMYLDRIAWGLSRSYGQGVSLDENRSGVKTPALFLVQRPTERYNLSTARVSLPLASSFTFFHWCWRQRLSWRRSGPQPKLTSSRWEHTTCWRLFVKHSSRLPHCCEAPLNGINRVLRAPLPFPRFLHSPSSN